MALTGNCNVIKLRHWGGKTKLTQDMITSYPVFFCNVLKIQLANGVKLECHVWFNVSHVYRRNIARKKRSKRTTGVSRYGWPFRYSYPNLETNEKNIFRYIIKNGIPQSVNDIRTALGMTEYKVRKSIQELETKELVCKIGNGASTKYMVKPGGAEMFTQLQMIMDLLRCQIQDK